MYEYIFIKVLNEGLLVEMDTPFNLLQDGSSYFYRMVKNTGPTEFGRLTDMARDAQSSKRNRTWSDESSETDSGMETPTSNYDGNSDTNDDALESSSHNVVIIRIENVDNEEASQDTTSDAEAISHQEHTDTVDKEESTGSDIASLNRFKKYILPGLGAPRDRSRSQPHSRSRSNSEGHKYKRRHRSISQPVPYYYNASPPTSDADDDEFDSSLYGSRRSWQERLRCQSDGDSTCNVGSADNLIVPFIAVPSLGIDNTGYHSDEEGDSGFKALTSDGVKHRLRCSPNSYDNPIKVSIEVPDSGSNIESPTITDVSHEDDQDKTDNYLLSLPVRNSFKRRNGQASSKSKTPKDGDPEYFV